MKNNFNRCLTGHALLWKCVSEGLHMTTCLYVTGTKPHFFKFFFFTLWRNLSRSSLVDSWKARDSTILAFFEKQHWVPSACVSPFFYIYNRTLRTMSFLTPLSSFSIPPIPPPSYPLHTNTALNNMSWDWECGGLRVKQGRERERVEREKGG